jgi:copper chaperone CopZ
MYREPMMATHDVEPNANAPVTLSISGMTCGGCAVAVKWLLSRVPRVARAEVDLVKGLALVEGSARRDALIAAVEAAGYCAWIART